MQKLNFPAFTFRFKNNENKVSIFDVIRKKFIRLCTYCISDSFIDIAASTKKSTDIIF